MLSLRSVLPRVLRPPALAAPHVPLRSIRTIPRSRASPVPPPKVVYPEVYEEPRVQCWVTSLDNQPRAIVSLHPDVWAAPIRKDLLMRVMEWQRAKRRKGTNKAKNRAEVSGSNKKPHGQKHTGRARQGTKRSAPHQKGGGVVHGPVPRSFAYDINQKIRALALKAALSAKAAEGNLLIIDDASFPTHRTRVMNKVLQPANYSSILFIDDEFDPNFVLAVRNFANVDILPVRGTNVYDLLRHRTLMMTLSAVRRLEARLTKSALAPPHPAEIGPDKKLKPEDATEQSQTESV